jgi:hypothetical protein
VVITLSTELEKALLEAARRKGVAPEALALDVLRARFLASASPVAPQDEWEQRLLGIATDCGASLPASALTSEGMYD